MSATDSPTCLPHLSWRRSSLRRLATKKYKYFYNEWFGLPKASNTVFYSSAYKWEPNKLYLNGHFPPISNCKGNFTNYLKQKQKQHNSVRCIYFFIKQIFLLGTKSSVRGMTTRLSLTRPLEGTKLDNLHFSDYKKSTFATFVIYATSNHFIRRSMKCLRHRTFKAPKSMGSCYTF